MFSLPSLFSLGRWPRPWSAALLLLAWGLLTPSLSAALVAPTGVTASATQPSNTAARWFKVKWTEASTEEDGFLVYVRWGTSGAFVPLITVEADATEAAFALDSQNIGVGTTMGFRVAAFQGEDPNRPTKLSPLSTIVQVVVPADTFNAPTNLTATPLDEGVIRLDWTDNSTTEEYFAIEMKKPEDEDFKYLGNVLFNSTTVNVTGFDTPGASREFRIRAFRGTRPEVGAASSANGTAYSNVAAAITKNLFLTGSTPWLRPQQATARWQTPYTTIIGTSNTANRTVFTATGLPPGLTFNETTGEIAGLPEQVGTFTVTMGASFTGGQTISGTLNLTVQPPVITNRAFHPATVGEPFLFEFETTSEVARTGVSLSGTLPPGLSFEATSLELSGTPTAAGVYPMTFSANFQGHSTVNQTFTLRVRPPNDSAPEQLNPFPKLLIVPGGSAVLDLKPYFRDPDAGAAVRLQTSEGPLDMLLYPDSTPQTVSNFLSYVAAGDYDGTVFHRSLPNFVLQGGGYFPVAAPNRFFTVPSRPSPINEPGISNLRGTVAMAKIGGLPNSATTNFFFNLADNSENLDNQNEGFTAFGRLSTDSLAVLDALAAKPRYTLNVALGNGGNQSMSDWPLDATLTPPVAMDQSKLLTIESAQEMGVMSYEVTGNSNPQMFLPSILEAVMALQIEENEISSDQLAAADAELEIKITALDQNEINTTIEAGIASGYRGWLTGVAGILSAGLPETPGMTWQWEKNGRPLRGANGRILEFPEVKLSDAGTYELVGTPSSGPVVRSGPLQVGVLDFSAASQSVRAGKTAVLTAKAAGPGFEIRWSRDGVLLSDVEGKVRGSGTSKLQILNFAAEDSGEYRCELVPTGTGDPMVRMLGRSVARQVTAITQTPVARTFYAPATSVRQPVSFQVRWDESDGARPTSVQVFGLPPGVTYNAATGVISGLPTRSGTYYVIIQSRNEAGLGQLTIVPLVISPVATGARGAFHAAVARDAGLNGNLGGMVTLTTTTEGAYSGLIRLGAATYRFRGLLEINPGQSPTFAVNIPRRNAAALELSGTLANSQISATLKVGTEDWALTGFQQITPTPSQQHRFHSFATVAEDDTEAANLPEGESLFIVDIQRQGAIRVTGWLVDGTRVTASLPLLHGGRLLWQQNLPGGGSLLGAATMTFVGLPQRSSLAGNLNWWRATTRPGFAPAAFGPQDFPWAGRRYVVPEGDFRPLDLPEEPDTNTALFGLLGSAVQSSAPVPEVDLTVKNGRLFLPSENPAKLRISLNLKTGIYAGGIEVKDGVGPNQLVRKATFRGLWIPETGGRGYFHLPGAIEPKVRTSGSADLLAPAP